MKCVLTVDLGNSAAKLVAWSLGDAPLRMSSLRWTAADAPGLIARWLPGQAFDAAWISSVASGAVRKSLEDALRARAGTPELKTPECGLLLDLPDPQRVGRDRLFAARGAWQLGRQSALVLDAGTALTVDAIRAEAGTARFLGGAIAPGPELLSRALAQGAAQLFDVQPSPPVPALGRETRSALESGVFHGFRGAARELVERIAGECALEQACVWLCGGARGWLEDPALFPGHELKIEADLVHRGLLAAGLDGR